MSAVSFDDKVRALRAEAIDILFASMPAKVEYVAYISLERELSAVLLLDAGGTPTIGGNHDQEEPFLVMFEGRDDALREYSVPLTEQAVPVRVRDAVLAEPTIQWGEGAPFLLRRPQA